MYRQQAAVQDVDGVVTDVQDVQTHQLGAGNAIGVNSRFAVIVDLKTLDGDAIGSHRYAGNVRPFRSSIQDGSGSSNETDAGRADRQRLAIGSSTDLYGRIRGGSNQCAANGGVACGGTLRPIVVHDQRGRWSNIDGNGCGIGEFAVADRELELDIPDEIIIGDIGKVWWVANQASVGGQLPGDQLKGEDISFIRVGREQGENF